MLEFAKLNIRKADHRINMVPWEELEDKIELLYKNDYLYNPYQKLFYNPLINKSIKAIATYNLTFERLENLINVLKADYFKYNDKPISIETINSMTLAKQTFYSISVIGFVYSGLLFIPTIIFYITGNFLFSSFTISVSLFLLNYYYKYNINIEKNNELICLADFWHKNKLLIISVRTVLFLIVFYLIFLTSRSYIISFFSIFCINYFSNLLSKKDLIKHFWSRCILDYLYNKDINK